MITGLNRVTCDGNAGGSRVICSRHMLMIFFLKPWDLYQQEGVPNIFTLIIHSQLDVVVWLSALPSSLCFFFFLYLIFFIPLLPRSDCVINSVLKYTRLPSASVSVMFLFFVLHTHRRLVLHDRNMRSNVKTLHLCVCLIKKTASMGLLCMFAYFQLTSSFIFPF